MIGSRIKGEKVFWDNKSRKQYTEGNDSKGACIEGCRQDQQCVQWMFTEEDIGSKCMFNEQFTIGEDVKKKENEEDDNTVRNWTAGWIWERVDKWTENFGPC